MEAISMKCGNCDMLNDCSKIDTSDDLCSDLDVIKNATDIRKNKNKENELKELW